MRCDTEAGWETMPSPDRWVAPTARREQQRISECWFPGSGLEVPAKRAPSCRGGCVTVLSFLAMYVVARMVLPCAFPWVWVRVHSCGDSVHPWQHRPAGQPTPRPPRYDVAVATVVDNFMSESMRERTIENKRQYADYWGYSVIAPSVEEVRRFAGGFPTAWAKLMVAKEALKTHEYVLMVDGDAVIMRADIDVALAIDEMEATGASLLISKDFNSLNSGIFIFKNNSWTNDFLAEATAARPMLAAKTNTIPLRYENRAFFYLTGMWPECYGICRIDALFAPTYTGTERFREGVLVVDRCLINRRPLRATHISQFLDSGAGFDELTNSFIMHVPGGDPESKRTAMDQLLRQSSLRHSQSLLAASS
jgi:hypothetical protein